MAKTPRKLDRTDLKLLAALQTEGRITNLKLAEKVGLSPSPCLERVKRLEAAGYIKRYSAEIDLDQLCRNVLVYAEVTLKNQRSEDYERFESVIAKIPEVIEAYSIGGGYDYLLKFVCTDVRDYQILSEKMINSDVGIDKFFSHIVIKPVKAYAGMPLHHLIEKDNDPSIILS
ncbi:Lrp/AsnC family transcriptional regulator [Elstera cyanobacteriorum]|uniref:AsnC family transcriptional regulator n=1 Tax=Elstera cyanobacteriorum TaxID=2022747 RepID=A0A255XJ36_9PROT|nr:Lrp/AsnC family transcriptional regulator [Elstera cyanobacteriorum]MCK6443883.1 Lrp/AsnC family transcriptional regulator [Elstera cyanobacteriorum]OYQ16967.1 AsnC family transcriptional regulator [Elstera cyanobacteriorum]GFZ89832.1 AsnC family transcriptional regulator [Elstera cyanobacteriorum]